MARIEDEIKTTLANDKHRLLVNMIFTSSWITTQYADNYKEFGISTQQVNILRILNGANDWLAMNVVKDRMIEKSPNATRLADKLLDKELIERKRGDEDRRVVFVKISKKGTELIAALMEKEKANPLTFIDNITAEEAKTANEILEKLRA